MSRKKSTKAARRNFIDRGNRLVLWWKSKGWSKNEFARKMGIWPQNVNKYFVGQLDPMNLVDPLRKEDCDILWILDGRKLEREPRGMVAELPVEYGVKKLSFPDSVSRQNVARVKKLAKLLEGEPEKADEEMLDLLIRSIEEKKKK